MSTNGTTEAGSGVVDTSSSDCAIPCPAGVPLVVWLLLALTPLAVAGELLWRVYISTNGLFWACGSLIWLSFNYARGLLYAQWPGRIAPTVRSYEVQKERFFVI